MRNKEIKIIRTRVLADLKLVINRKLTPDWVNAHNFARLSLFKKFIHIPEKEVGILHVSPSRREIQRCYLQNTLEILFEDLERNRINFEVLGFDKGYNVLNSTKFRLEEIAKAEIPEVFFINLQRNILSYDEAILLRKIADTFLKNNCLIILITPHQFEYLQPHLGYFTYLAEENGYLKRKIHIDQMDEEEILVNALHNDFDQIREKRNFINFVREILDLTQGRVDLVERYLNSIY